MDLEHLRQAYGWDGDISLSAGPRGALGQIWRVNDVFALKEIFRRPPSEAAVDAELRFCALASAAGVRLPLSHPDRDGRYLHRTPGGTWLRLYDWIDLRPVDPAAPSTPDQLGTLLARLHRCAPPTPPDGDTWYEEFPAADHWPAHAERIAALPDLCAPADPADLIVCHRDLHPENVLAAPDGGLVVVDWDCLGPAAPQRELARMLFDWYCDGPALDLDAMCALYAAYVRAGGPGRITDPADFTALLASRLNFLLVQLRIAVDPATEPRHRAWADREIDEGLRILPTARQLTDVLAALR
ncbi:phosphotransferase [Dactylosporangium sp. NBC_01737]|uniref:phosphotransferase enzyme family protein n=1 Tax=Dactylosporangium sp. NBC_01737 TaxID=2975959 RepID=UPI002E118384|nr:phosphotransferase [Dactylosporangium sp. NBC_01737]